MTEKKSIYANNAVIGLGQFEATIVFQRISLKPGTIVTPGQQDAVVAEEVDVIMALSHLKVFAASVLESVYAYEQQQQSIPMPAELERRFLAAVNLYSQPTTVTRQ